MGDKGSKISWVLGGAGAVLFGCFLLYLAAPRWFGARFVHFDGAIKQLEALGADRLFVIEDVQTGGGEDGPTTVGDRWRILDLATGKILVGPHFIDPTSWARLQGDRLLMKSREDLELRDFDNKLIANLASWTGVAKLRRSSNDVTLGEDGSITAMSEEGRFFQLDPKTLRATPVAGRVPSAAFRPLGSASVPGLELRGRPRAQINGKGRDYLEPQWVEDPGTLEAIKAADGFLLLHYQRLTGSKEGRGPILSAVNAQGEEEWRYVLPFEHLYAVVKMGEQLVLGINEHSEYGPGWIRVISLATGQEGWRLAL